GRASARAEECRRHRVGGRRHGHQGLRGNGICLRRLGLLVLRERERAQREDDHDEHGEAARFHAASSAGRPDRRHSTMTPSHTAAGRSTHRWRHTGVLTRSSPLPPWSTAKVFAHPKASLRGAVFPSTFSDQRSDGALATYTVVPSPTLPLAVAKLWCCVSNG